jgi:putative transposase
MPISQVNKDINHCQYFITMTIQKWYYIFDRYDRWNILSNSLKYCQKHKGLKIYTYVFMLNHIHMIIQSDDVAGFLRDFKKHTSRKLKENLKQTEPEVLKLFINKETGKYSFWQMSNKPVLLESEKFFLQKMKYIYNNPVKKGYVERPEYWKWSSANPNSEIKVSGLFE